MKPSSSVTRLGFLLLPLLSLGAKRGGEGGWVCFCGNVVGALLFLLRDAWVFRVVLVGFLDLILVFGFWSSLGSLLLGSLCLLFIFNF